MLVQTDAAPASLPLFAQDGIDVAELDSDDLLELDPSELEEVDSLELQEIDALELDGHVALEPLELEKAEAAELDATAAANAEPESIGLEATPLDLRKIVDEIDSQGDTEPTPKIDLGPMPGLMRDDDTVELTRSEREQLLAEQLIDSELDANPVSHAGRKRRRNLILAVGAFAAGMAVAALFLFGINRGATPTISAGAAQALSATPQAAPTPSPVVTPVEPEVAPIVIDEALVPAPAADTTAAAGDAEATTETANQVEAELAALAAADTVAEPSTTPAPAASGEPVAKPALSQEAAAKPAVAKKQPTRKAKQVAKKATRAKKTSKSTKSKTTKKRVATATAGKSKRNGLLMLGSKPPCQIYIDGRNTGKTTPQRAIKLSPGKHKVTLRNKQHKISKTLTVDIKPGRKLRVIRDMSDRIKK